MTPRNWRARQLSWPHCFTGTPSKPKAHTQPPKFRWNSRTHWVHDTSNMILRPFKPQFYVWPGHAGCPECTTPGASNVGPFLGLGWFLVRMSVVKDRVFCAEPRKGTTFQGYLSISISLSLYLYLYLYLSINLSILMDLWREPTHELLSIFLANPQDMHPTSGLKIGMQTNITTRNPMPVLVISLQIILS